MIHYYCFVPTQGKITAATKVFRVAVGSSSEDATRVMIMESYAKRHGLYFHLWNDDANREIDSRLIQRPTNAYSVGRGCRVVYVSIKSLRQAIIEGRVYALEDDPEYARNYFRMASTLCPSFFFQNIGKKIKSALPPFPRKNLSVRPSSEDISAAIGFAALLFLYWLGCMLLQWEKAVCG